MINTAMNNYSQYLISTTTFNHKNSEENSLSGDPIKGAGYLGFSGRLHSFQCALSDFKGNVYVQAAIVTSIPDEDDWFTISKREFLEEESTVYIDSVPGNFVWIRGKAEIKKGSINSLLMNY